MTKKDFITELSSKMATDQKTAAIFLEALVNTIEETIAAGDSIYLPGLGKFEASLNPINPNHKVL